MKLRTCLKPALALSLTMALTAAALCLFAVSGAVAADCPKGFVKTSSGMCIKPDGKGAPSRGMTSQSKSSIPSSIPSSVPSSGAKSMSKKEKKSQQEQQVQAQYRPQQQQQGRPPQQGQQGQQGRSAACHQALANCNAVCAQNYAAHRNPAVYNACLVNCNLGFNTCR